MNYEETTAGAQGILDFVNDFADEHRRYPKLSEIPINKHAVFYHFGSYEALIRIARVGEAPPELRKGSKKRYCRYTKCRALLPRNRWFFCNDECEEAHRLENEEKLSKKDIENVKKKRHRKMWHKCKDCKQKCKIYLPGGMKEPPAKIVCKADPEYGEINEKFSKSL